MKDIQLNKNDLQIQNGDFVMGDSLEQDVELIIQLTQGELKSDPILGCDLYRMVNSNATASEVKAKMKLHLERDDKNYEEIKDMISVNGKTT